MAQPVLDDAPVPRDDVVLPLGVLLVYLRQILEAPPAAVIIREVTEIVPRIELRILSLTGAIRAVVAAAVEVPAVRAGVGIHAVEDEPYPLLLPFRAQVLEILHSPEYRVGARIVRGIVAVVRPRFDYGVEVHNANAELFEIRQLLLYAFQRPAVEIVGAVGLLPAARLPAYRLIKACVQLRCLTEALVVLYPRLRRAVVRESKTIREYLVHHPFSEPCRCFKALFIHRQPEARLTVRAYPAGIARRVRTEPLRAVIRLYIERIPERLRLLGQHEVYIIYVSVVFHGAAVLHIVAP